MEEKQHFLSFVHIKGFNRFFLFPAADPGSRQYFFITAIFRSMLRFLTPFTKRSIEWARDELCDTQHKGHGPKNCPTVTMRNNPISEGTHVFLGDNLLLIWV